MIEAFFPIGQYTDFMARYFSDTAALLSDPGRAAILMALMDRRALPAGQLAMIANVAAQTASSHLSKLVDGGLLRVEQQGRHRYYRLADTEVANAIEALLAISPGGHALAVMPRQAVSGDLAHARTCYSHLAGRLGVDIADAFQCRGILVEQPSKSFLITDRGQQWFQGLGIVVTDRKRKDVRFARRCLDWTERRPHLAGPLGATMLTRCLELRWLARIRNSRALRVTHEGQRKFQDVLGIVPEKFPARHVS